MNCREPLVISVYTHLKDNKLIIIIIIYIAKQECCTLEIWNEFFLSSQTADTLSGLDGKALLLNMFVVCCR